MYFPDDTVVYLGPHIPSKNEYTPFVELQTSLAWAFFAKYQSKIILHGLIVSQLSGIIQKIFTCC